MRRTALVVLSAAAVVAACEVVADIHDKDFGYLAPDGSTADAAPAGPVCAHEGPPGPPSPVATATERSYVLAMKSFDFEGTNPDGTLFGFDLDGVCTCDPLDDKHEAGPSCSPPPNPLRAGGCDDDGGIDNAMGQIVQVLESYPSASGFSSLVGNSAACGAQTVLLFIGGYNGQANDDSITVATLPSYGIREEHDGGDYPDADCVRNVAPYPAKWDGHDRWSVPDGAVLSRPGGDQIIPDPATLWKGWVKDYTLVIDGRGAPNEAKSTIFVAGQRMGSSTTVLRAKLVPDGDSFQIRGGLLGGRVSTAALLSALGRFKIRDSQNGDGFLCDPAGRFRTVYDLIKPLICSGRDLRFDGADFKGLPCDAISIGFHFDAVPAEVGTTFDPVPADGGCADFTDECGDGG